MAGLFDGIVVMSQLRMGRWDEILRAARPAANTPVSIAWWRYSRAMALAMQGCFDDARREQAEFENASAALDRNAPWGVNKAGDVMDLAATVLEARLANSPASSVPIWRKAVAQQDGLAYDEPPPWYYPVRESLGAALLLSGDAAGAEDAFREGLKSSRRNRRMLFGLLESLKAQKKTGAAECAQKQLDAVYSGAEIQLRISEL